jgi:hypothetical protein
MTGTDRQQTTGLWSSIFAFFMEGVALYGASYCGSLPPIASAVGPSPNEASAAHPVESSWRERRRAIAIVSSSMDAEVTEVEDDADRSNRRSGQAARYRRDR